MSSSLPIPLSDSYCFFGEKYRTCFDYLHITNAAKLILFVDILKNTLETYFFSLYIGYLDAFIVLHLSWTIIGYFGCVFGFFYERYYGFWPSLALKLTECVICLVCLFGIFILVMIGTVSKNILKILIQYKYPRVEANQVVSFSLLLFVVIAILLIMNICIFDVLFRTQLYYRRRGMALYQIERQVIMRRILIH
ncbi:hypothetical protein M3Y95_00674000 [Aphelenchoides besseyi]|nr:hypothetical protein M3Y95_00674000 [Aphelenchoides besseyi]